MFSPEKWEERPLLGKLLATSDLKDVQIVGLTPFLAMHMETFSISPHIGSLSYLWNQYRLVENQGHKVVDDITKQICQPESMEQIKISLHLFNFLNFVLILLLQEAHARSSCFSLQKGWPAAHCKWISSFPCLYLPFHKLIFLLSAFFRPSPQKFLVSFARKFTSSHHIYKGWDKKSVPL